MKKVFLPLMCLFSLFACAHTVNYSHVIQKHWNINEHKFVDGSFYMYKNGDVYIEDAKNQVVHYPLKSMSIEDQKYVMDRYNKILKANEQLLAQSHNVVAKDTVWNPMFFLAIFLVMGLAVYTVYSFHRAQFKYLLPILMVGIITTVLGFSNHRYKTLRSTTTDPLFIDSAFSYFKPNVVTSWDSVYFHVGSYGIADHPMMAGITAWQRQVPIPQCYFGSNTWSIPLNPVLAANPVPVNQHHFLRGAVALAVNGIPIFNPYTNTGADAFLTGQLDSFGGHCGRADDYHYHIAPVVLYRTHLPVSSPVAFALDGFAVYGSVEPDGSPMATLDANHGHYGTNGVYHYHASLVAPYMIGNMVGQVTEDTTLQIIPQAAAHPIRAGQSPLAGAVITACHPNGITGFTLIYTVGGFTDSIVYSWTTTGVYTFNFYHQGVDTGTQTYHGFIPCYNPVSTAISELAQGMNRFRIYPNPSTGDFYLTLDDETMPSDVQGVMVYGLTGNMVYQSNGFVSKINLDNLSPGVYIVKIGLPQSQMTQKIIVSSSK